MKRSYFYIPGSQIIHVLPEHGYSELQYIFDFVKNTSFRQFSASFHTKEETRGKRLLLFHGHFFVAFHLTFFTECCLCTSLILIVSSLSILLTLNESEMCVLCFLLCCVIKAFSRFYQPTYTMRKGVCIMLVMLKMLCQLFRQSNNQSMHAKLRYQVQELCTIRKTLDSKTASKLVFTLKACLSIQFFTIALRFITT